MVEPEDVVPLTLDVGTEMLLLVSTGVALLELVPAMVLELDAVSEPTELRPDDVPGTLLLVSLLIDEVPDVP